MTDEKINTIISTIGAVLSFFATGYLIVMSMFHQKPWHVMGFGIYGFTLINLFVISAMHHGINATERAEHVLRQFDYFSIFLFIAGCFTPVCLVLVPNVYGYAILTVIWVAAVIGILIKAFYPDIPKWATNAMYVAMGWVGALYVVPVYHKVEVVGLILFAIGGILYTTGSFIYYVEKPNPISGKFGFHEIWHLFVFVAAAVHYCFMYFFILPS